MGVGATCCVAGGSSSSVVSRSSSSRRCPISDVRLAASSVMSARGALIAALALRMASWICSAEAAARSDTMRWGVTAGCWVAGWSRFMYKACYYPAGTGSNGQREFHPPSSSDIHTHTHVNLVRVRILVLSRRLVAMSCRAPVCRCLDHVITILRSYIFPRVAYHSELAPEVL